MTESDITFIFTVGGDNVHYENMERCIRSIRKHLNDVNFLVLEFGNKLKSDNRVQILNMPDIINFKSGKKVGYLIWKHKYVGALHVKTKFGVYIDTDTVLANNTILDLLKNLSGGIGVTRHFWVPNIAYYQARATDNNSIHEFLDTKLKLNLKDESPFFAGGVFLFENNNETRSVFQDVLKMYDDYYTNKDYVKSITDELFLAAALTSKPHLVRIFGGALNHCSMGDENMPLTEYQGFLYGRNSFESEWQPVSFLHCDTSRRDPSEMYEGSVRSLVRSAFELDEK
jgi:hypothetical protein